MGKRWLSGAVVGLATLALAACGAGATATPEPTATPTETPVPTATPTPTLPAGWTRVEVAPVGEQMYPGGGHSFSIALPPGWTATEGQGLDSFVGKIEGDGATLHWDLGWYSSPLPYDDDPEYAVTTETIGDREAKLVRSASAGAAGVYFATFHEPETDDQFSQVIKLTIYGEDLGEAQIETAMAMFRTVR